MEKIKPEKAIEIWGCGGIEISVEQATQFLELLKKFENIIVGQYLESQRKA